MAQLELPDFLKTLKTTLVSSDTKRVCAAYIRLIEYVEDSNSGFVDQLLKGVFKCMCSSLGRYNSYQSRTAAVRFVQTVVKRYTETCGKHFIDGSKEFCEKNATSSYGADVLDWLDWSCYILPVIAGKEDILQVLIKYIGLVNYAVSKSDRKTVQLAAKRFWVRIVSKHGDLLPKFISVLSEGDVLLNFPTLSGLVKAANLCSTVTLDDVSKSKMLDLLTKTVFALKSRPSSAYMASCHAIIESCSHNDFESIVLATAKRFMLRSPEVALFVLVPYLEYVKLDLSKYAEEIGKLLTAEAKNKDEERRREAVRGFQYLANQCSNPDDINKVLLTIFNVLVKGQGGKVTVIQERMDLTSAAGAMSANTVSGALAKQTIATEAMTQFAALLKQDTNEAQLVHAITELINWVKLSPTSTPNELMERIQMGISPKTLSTLVRQAYLSLMTTCFVVSDTMQQLKPLEPTLMATLTSANNQPAQLPLVTEAVFSAALLVRLSRADLLAGDNMASMFKILLNTEKQLLINDRLLLSASGPTLLALVSLSENLILQWPDKLNDTATQYYLSAIVFAACHNLQYVRKAAQSSITKIISGLGGLLLALETIGCYEQLLYKQNWDEYFDDSADTKAAPVLTAKGFTETLLAMTSLPNGDGNEMTQLTLAVLIPSHHRAISKYQKKSWIRLLGKFKLSADKLVDQNIDRIADKLVDGKMNQCKMDTIKTLIELNGLSTVPTLLNRCRGLLSDPDLLKVTAEEYNIFQWPEGELYDTSVVEKNKESDDVRNMRRENKLYSYKDQLMEMELRKELEAKRRAEGKHVEKLSKKQIEAKQAQLKEESDIRARIALLDAKVKLAAQVLQAISSSNHPSIAHFLPRICEIITPLIGYPVTANHLSSVYVTTIRSAIVGQKQLVSGYHLYLCEVVGVLTLRVYEAACELPKRWLDEPLERQRDRVLHALAEASPMNAATFACCYPLLKNLLKKSSMKEELKLSMLQIFLAHVKLRSDLETDGPALLPRCDMLSVLLELIDTGSKKMSQLASGALIELCISASGDDGCTLAESDEIETLLDALKSANDDVRRVALTGLIQLEDALPTPESDLSLGNQLMKRLWIAKFDVDKSVASLADQLWEEMGLELDTTIASDFLEDVVSPVESLRTSAVQALVKLLHEDRSLVSGIIQMAISVYEEKLYRAPAEIDDFGRVLREQQADQWQSRAGIALLLKLMSPLLRSVDISTLTPFYVPTALHDRDENVGLMMRAAAIELVENHGKSNVESLLPVLEKTLTDLPNSGSYDVVKQGVIVMMGNLAKHLDKDDERVKPIVGKLIASLSVPSQPVQEAVANCLPPLVPAIKASVPEMITKLTQLLLSADNYGERRGAAYGLAGIVKGSGILILKQQDIMNTLTTAIQNKKSAVEREGALFAFEMLSLMLGRLFEPYIVHVLPYLLLCFGDNNLHVRAAANDTAKAVMSKLSAHGVKLVLPILLTALQEDQWRTKCGSVELLGAMAFCAPKQLSACLPQIVPQLVDVLADSHDKVSNAGATALQHIGEVIKNPEIQSIVPTLLGALKNPNTQTTACLQTLLDTQFVHFIDAPSLALIMPVVTRAIEDRTTETRKMACQIIGNMYSLTDQKDLAPYLVNIMPGLKKSLVDPVPEVRSMSARALGAMVRSIGDQGFDELQPWLMQTLTSDGNTVNRSGAAQGLSEVIGAIGAEKLKSTVSEIIQTASRSDIPAYVKDGYIMMFIYLPMTFGDEFRQYVGPILPTVLKALADESEYVRETGLKAGQKIINMYAETSIELLLPELEKGLFDENWRIRLSSVQLLGDLLYKLSGVSGKMSTETAHEDDNFGTEIGQQTVIELLGLERRNRVLSGLYMGRSDTALMVRQASLHVWKVIVSNTPKTLRDILPTLFSLLLGCLASTSYDKREVAARTLGDVVKKLGERVLPEILPILRVGLDSPDSDKRQGVCIGLSEIMKSTSREQVVGYSDSLIPTVCKALSDPVAPVRHAAAKTFDALHSNLGMRALEDILPQLLDQLNDEATKDYALDGLQQVMAVKSHAVLPYLIPHLTAEPINTKALSLLASVAGPALDKELHKILEALCKSLAGKIRTPYEQEEVGFCTTVVLSLQTDASVRTTIEILLKLIGSQDPKTQTAAAWILNAFCKDTKLDYEDYLIQLFRNLIGQFINEDELVLDAVWECVASVVKKLDNTRCMLHVTNVRQAVRYAVSDVKDKDTLPGFCLPKKGITCILPIYREGLLNGSPELKETSALSLSEAIRVASSDALKPSVVHITGPLIRVLGDRYGPTVRVAMLETITVLLEKCGPMLKPFIPQLQTTFLKALNDPGRPVRLKAGDSMSQLIIIHIRVDPVFTEMNNCINNTEDSSIRETYLHALRLCLVAGGSKMGVAVRQETTKTLLKLLSHQEDGIRTTAAACLGAVTASLPDEERADVIINHLLNAEDSDWIVKQARAAALFVALKECSNVLLGSDKYREDIVKTLQAHASSDKVSIAQFGLRGMAMVLKRDLETGHPLDERLVIASGKGMKNDSNDVKQLIGQMIELVCRVANQNSESGLDVRYQKIWVPVLVNGSREKNSAVKAASEYALITMLRLRKSEDGYNALVTNKSYQDAGKADALSDIYNKNLKKLLKQNEPKEEEFDVTLLRY